MCKVYTIYCIQCHVILCVNVVIFMNDFTSIVMDG